MREPPSFLEEKRRERIRERADKETDWFFGIMGGRVPEPGIGPAYARPAAQAVDGWLRSIPPFHRGALSLMHDKREWPEALREKYRWATSLVVRLECARLADGSGRSASELEALAVRRLEEDIAACQRRRAVVEDTHRHAVPTVREVEVRRRAHRAYKHVELALRAYSKARGNARCVLPRGVDVDDPELDVGGDL